MSDWSAWAWLGFAVVAIVVLAGLAFVLWAVMSGVLDAQRQQRAGKACPRCGLAWGATWPPKGHDVTVPDDPSGAAS